MKIQKVYIGGWFQRTTLHLTEVWDFLKHAKSNVGFSEKQLKDARLPLGIISLSREADQLEYVLVHAKDISYRIYEDGLMVLEKDVVDLKKDFNIIKDYYENKLSKALSLIFSKGAPIPKELANIKTILPYIVIVEDATKPEIEKLYKNFKEEIYSIIETKNVLVYRSSGIILISNLADERIIRKIIETQIFFREFKSQLHRYLNIHRIVWEKISAIKEKGSIRGTAIDAQRNELSDYQKTITLIEARINQMGTYIKTRQKITDLSDIDKNLHPLFQSKFDTLLDTHDYIKYLWDMTADYLQSTIQIFSDLREKSTKNSIASLQVITTLGVVAAILGYLGRDKLPYVTMMGLAYFVILVGLTWLLNLIVSRFYKSRKYELKASKIIKL